MKIRYIDESWDYENTDSIISQKMKSHFTTSLYTALVLAKSISFLVISLENISLKNIMQFLGFYTNASGVSTFAIVNKNESVIGFLKFQNKS